MKLFIPQRKVLLAIPVVAIIGISYAVAQSIPPKQQQSQTIPKAPPQSGDIINPNPTEGVTDLRIKRAITAFNKRDMNGDGSITLDEYINTMSTRGQTQPPANMQGVPNKQR